MRGDSWIMRFIEQRSLVVFMSVFTTGIIPILASIAGHRFFGDIQYIQNPLHEAVEIFGGSIAFVVAILLILRAAHGLSGGYLLWISMGLIVMGLLDAIHGIYGIQIHAWQRHLATFLGGLLFSLAWFSVPKIVLKNLTAFLVILGFLTLLLGLFAGTSIFPAAYRQDGSFLWPVKMLNLLGGLGFVLSSLFFYSRYMKSKLSEDVTIAGLSVLFGISGLFFGFSHIWGIEWWIWHALRFIAFVAIVPIAFREIQKLVKSEAEARIKAESYIAGTEEKFRILFDNSPIGKSLTEIDGSLHVNKSFSDIVGYSEEEMKTLTWQEFTHPDDRELVAGIIDSLMNNRTDTARFKKRYIHKNGAIVWCDVSAYLQKDKNGKAQYFITTISDITYQKNAEKTILHLNKLYEVLSQCNKAIVRIPARSELFREICRIIVESGGFRFAWIGALDDESNQIIPEALHGFEDGFLKQAFTEITEDKRHQLLSYRAVNEGRTLIINDVEHEPGIDSWRTAALSRNFKSIASAPIKLNSRVIGVFSIYSAEADYFNNREVDLLDEMGVDISFALETMNMETARRNAENEIKRLNEELEYRVMERTEQLKSVNNELEAFTYSVSHDLRAPLRHAGGYIELLAKRFPESMPEKAKHYFESLKVSIRQMGLLIDDLLQFSRTGRKTIEIEVLNMNKMIRDEMNSYQEEVKARNIKLKTGILPEVHGDYILINLVWSNLISNAVKFTKYTDNPEIEIGFQQEGDEHVFFVRDNGAGFDMLYAEKLFGVFQRLHSSDEFEGTGIGLANVKRTILRHGGRVWATGELNKGATFYFTLNNRIKT
jgi:PAS domain S-box-containing protein